MAATSAAIDGGVRGAAEGAVLGFAAGTVAVSLPAAVGSVLAYQLGFPAATDLLVPIAAMAAPVSVVLAATALGLKDGFQQARSAWGS